MFTPLLIKLNAVGCSSRCEARGPPLLVKTTSSDYAPYVDFGLRRSHSNLGIVDQSSRFIQAKMGPPVAKEYYPFQITAYPSRKLHLALLVIPRLSNWCAALEANTHLHLLRYSLQIKISPRTRAKGTHGTCNFGEAIPVVTTNLDNFFVPLKAAVGQRSIAQLCP